MSGDRAAGGGSLDPTDAAFVEVVSDLLARGHSVRFRAKGSSMTPTIREGEAITVAPVRPAEIRRGDVVLYLVGQSVTAHRVVSVKREPGGALLFVTRGDASASCDEPVGEAALLGIVAAVERGGRVLDPAAGPARAWAVMRSRAARLLRSLRSLPGA
jgi:signal peptidase I